MKAILELGDMPDNCHNCVLSTCYKKIWVCAAYERIVDITDEVNNYRKNIGCPLREVEE